MSLLWALVPAVATAGAPCFPYGPATVELSGKVVLETFWGPPNYGEDPKSDSRETQALLVLDHPICVAAGSGEDEPPEQQQTKITLVPQNGEKLAAFANQRARVVGALFHAFDGHHHTPLLVEIESITKARGR